ncbi:MAG: general secretion pathway protein C [Tepidimonas sp.]|nr:general secretion pathway protein C [Tepidimonas sp.]
MKPGCASRLSRVSRGICARGRIDAVLPVTLVAWALAGWMAAWWGWRWWALRAPVVSVSAPPSSPPQVTAEAMARALGATQQPRAVPSSAPMTPMPWRLLGVAAASDGGGAALLARGDQPARAFRAGAMLPDGWRVQRIEHDGVWLAPPEGGEAVRLAAPVRPVPSAGPPATGG